MKNKSKIFEVLKTIIVSFLMAYCFYFFISTINDHTHEKISFNEAGTDYSKVFNDKRKVLILPIIPQNWKHLDSLHFKIQNWINPDTVIPRYAEKLVSSDIKAIIDHETDRYNLKRIDKDFNYQLVIEFSYKEYTRKCTI